MGSAGRVEHDDSVCVLEAQSPQDQSALLIVRRLTDVTVAVTVTVTVFVANAHSLPSLIFEAPHVVDTIFDMVPAFTFETRKSNKRRKRTIPVMYG